MKILTRKAKQIARNIIDNNGKKHTVQSVMDQLDKILEAEKNEKSNEQRNK